MRTISLDQRKLGENERLFAVVINGVRTFCKGGNWIPADSIYARVTDDKYRTLGSEAKCRDAGKLAIEGKEYVMRDGDVVHFRFNV